MCDVLGDRVRSQVTLVFRTLSKNKHSPLPELAMQVLNQSTIQVTDWTELERLQEFNLRRLNCAF